MRITNLDVDGYGVWSGLRIQGLADSMNVFYGPNEAGKTTLLEFIRSMLYGFSPERSRYLPPLHGGGHHGTAVVGGGTLELCGPHGRFQVARHVAADGSPGEQLLISAPDGTRQGEHFLKVLLSDVDQSVFNNVFAFGLREIQELATLGDTAAAELLYSLTAGLDRVSLVEVMRELEASRNRVLDAAGGPCQVVQLLAEHEKLRAEIQDLAAINHRYAHLAAERGQLDGEITRLEEESNRTQQLARTTDAALAVHDLWHERGAIDEQLASFGPVKAMPEDALARLDALAVRIQKHQRHAEHLSQTRQDLRREFDGLTVNDALWRHSARIEAMKEQEPWIAQLRDEIAGLESEIGTLQAELAAEAQQLGLGADTAAIRYPSSQELLSLRSPARLLGQARRRQKEAKQAAATAAAAADSITQQIQSALAARGTLARSASEGRELGPSLALRASVASPSDASDTVASGLAAALDQAGNLVSQFRRREQLDGRLDQLARYQTELEDRSRGLVDRQLLPVGVLGALGALFVFGVVLILSWLIMPTAVTGTIGPTLAVLGLAGFLAAVGGKVLLERSNVQQLDACRKQLDLLHSQVEQTLSDRDALDAQLPRGGGPIAARLQAAEKELAALEGLTPVDGRRAAARQEAEAAARRAAEAATAVRGARRRWRQVAVAAGLPETITPKQARRLAAHGDRIAQSQRQLAVRQEEVLHRRREMDALLARIVQLAADAGVQMRGEGGRGKGEIRGLGTSVPSEVGDTKPDPSSLLRTLADAAESQQATVARRDAIRREARKLRTAQTRREEAIGRLKHRRRALFIEAGVPDEQDFRNRALECARAEVLRQDRDRVAREIEAALAGRCSEDAVRRQLEGTNPAHKAATGGRAQDAATGGRAALEARRNDLQQRAVILKEQLRILLEKHGRNSAELDALAADNRLASKHLDLAMLETRIEDALHRWQVLAATCSVLDSIRVAYEKDRQPETLQEASGYLERLTEGRYRRVWTPLGQHVLRVDDAEGRPLPVEALSRGTREQLFLSLRLALASSYARRGAPLPLVLDDVLVNFDAGRAKAAAAVLRDFAAAGHQLLIFTCHEHILKLFKALKMPVSRLPKNSEPGQVVIQVERRPDEEKPKRERRPRQPRRPPIVEVEEPDEPADEGQGDENSSWEDEGDADGAFEDSDDGGAAAA